jgi:hypothetical protein
VARIAQENTQGTSHRPKGRIFSNINGSTLKDGYSLPFRIGSELT